MLNSCQMSLDLHQKCSKKLHNPYLPTLCRSPTLSATLLLLKIYCYICVGGRYEITETNSGQVGMSSFRVTTYFTVSITLNSKSVGFGDLTKAIGYKSQMNNLLCINNDDIYF